MGFGRGKGFTAKVLQFLASVIIRGGGGKATRTETVITETVILASGSYP